VATLRTVQAALALDYAGATLGPHAAGAVPLFEAIAVMIIAVPDATPLGALRQPFSDAARAAIMMGASGL